MSVLTLRGVRAGAMVIAAAGALALAALPSAAHAAEVVTCTEAPTALTQPWLTFSQTGNIYETADELIEDYVDTTIGLTTALPASFTAGDLAAYQTGLENALDALNSAGGGDSNPFAQLQADFEAVDPDNTSGWQEQLLALLTAFTEQAEPVGLEEALDAYNDSLEEFSDAAEAVVAANEPAGGPYQRPTIPETLEADGDDLIAAFTALAPIYQTTVLDGAAALVVYEESCVTTTVADAPVAAAPAKTLAATGTSDGLVLGGVAAGLLLLGGLATAAIRRTRSA